MVDIATTQKRYLRIDEIAELFGLSRRSVYYWIRKKKISAVNPGGGAIRVPVEDVRHLIDSGSATSGPERVKAVPQNAEIPVDTHL